MISSIDLFLSRDCADGAGPIVELAIPAALLAVLPAPPVVGPDDPVVAPVAVAGCEVEAAPLVAAGKRPGVELEDAAGLLKRFGVAPELLAAPEVGVLELAPPSPENSEDPGAVDVGAPLVAVVVVVELVGADAVGLLPREKPAPVADAPEKRLLVGAEDVPGAVEVPPRLKPDAGVVEDGAGCEEAGVVPKEKAGFAGVEEGVVLLFSPPNNDLGASDAVLEFAAAFPPPKRLPAGAVEVGAVDLFASLDEPVFPNKPVLGVELPEGFAAAAPNKLGESVDVVVAGFAPPNKPELGCVFPPAWLVV